MQAVTTDDELLRFHENIDQALSQEGNYISKIEK